MIAVDEDVVPATASHDLVADVSRDPLSASIPESDLAVAIDQIHSDRERIEYGTTNLWIVKWRHANALSGFIGCPLGKLDGPRWI